MNTIFPMEMHSHADLVPSYVEMTEVDKDSPTWDDLTEISSGLNELCTAVDDTRQAVGNDLYLAYLSFYQSVA